MLQSIIQDIHALESRIACDTDAVLHKATQESLELIDALRGSDVSHIKEELADAIGNILSAYSRVTGEYEIEVAQTNMLSSLLDVAIQLGKWNDTVQKYRTIYSRSIASKEYLKKETETLVGLLIGEAGKFGVAMDISELLQMQHDKFNSRIDSYGMEICLEDYIADVPDFPKAGILFKDISPLLKNPKAFSKALTLMAEDMRDVDVIVGLDARGFLFGSTIAQHLEKPFVMLRKKGKLPGDCIEDSYDLEYGSNIQTLQRGSIKPGDKVAIVDDLLATGGTAQSAIRLVRSQGADVQGCHFLIVLDSLEGENNLDVPVYGVLHYA